MKLFRRWKILFGFIIGATITSIISCYIFVPRYKALQRQLTITQNELTQVRNDYYSYTPPKNYKVTKIQTLSNGARDVANATMQIHFQIPSSMKNAQISDQDGTPAYIVISYPNPSSVNMSDNWYSVHIGIIGSTNQESLESVVNKTYEQIASSLKSCFLGTKEANPLTKIIIGGESAYKLVSPGCSRSGSETYYVSYNNNIYSIGISAGSNNFKQNISLLQTILPSFQFTK